MYQGEEVEGAAEGYLVIKRSWPSGMRTLSGDHDRFQNVYFSNFKGYYMTGDGAKRDEDGYYWLIGMLSNLLTSFSALVRPTTRLTPCREHFFKVPSVDRGFQ